jgi:hypothetical protein
MSDILTLRTSFTVCYQASPRANHCSDQNAKLTDLRHGGGGGQLRGGGGSIFSRIHQRETYDTHFLKNMNN